MKIFLISGVVSWAHRPIAIFLGVPGYREFHQFTFSVTMQITPSLIARANHIVDALLNCICLFAIEPHLIAPLIVFVAPSEHRVVVAGGLVVNGVLEIEILNHISSGWLVERTRHSRMLERLSDVLV